MASKNHANIKIGAETKDAEKGIKNVSDRLDGVKNSAQKPLKGLNALTAKLNEFTKANQKTLGSITMLSNAFNAFKGSFGFVTDAISSAVSTMNELSEAYNVQVGAEQLLAASVKNNPYMSSGASEALKSFASELQSYTVYGDEYTMPLMANLAAQGRTTSEVMDIMRAAADLAAGSGMSLESAIQALNGTLNGNAGVLGKQNAAIKALTAEQLKSGEAIRIISEQYAGMAKTSADATGQTQKLSNAWGDFKELLGSVIAPAINNFKANLTGLITAINDAFADRSPFDEQIQAWGELGAAGLAAADKIHEAVKKLKGSVMESAATALEAKASAAASLLKDQNEIFTGYQNRLREIQGEINEIKKFGVWGDEEAQLKALVAEQKRLNAEARKLGQEMEMSSAQVRSAEAEVGKLNDKLKDHKVALGELSKEGKKAQSAIESGTATLEDYQRVADEYDEHLKEARELCEANIAAGADERAEKEKLVKVLEAVKTERAHLNKIGAEQLKADEKARKSTANQADLVRRYYTLVVNAKLKEIAVRKAAGEAISAESEAQQIANTKMSAYLSYLKAGGEESGQLMEDVKKSYTEMAKFAKATTTPKKDVLGDALKAYDASIKKVKEEIKYRRQLGEVISETEEKEKVLAAMRSGYITLRQSAGSTLTDMSETSRAILASADALEKQLKPIQELKKAYEELSKAGKNYVDSLNLDDRSEADKLRESVQAQITKINEMLGDDSGGISEEAVKSFYKKWRAYMDKYSGKGLTAEAYASLIGGNKKLTDNQKDFMRDFEATFKSAGRSAEELAELNKELEEYNALLEAVKFTDVYGSFKSELEKISLDDTRSQLEKLREQLSGLDEIASAAHDEINRLMSSDDLSDDDSRRLSAMISLMEEYKEKRIQIEKDITEATEAEYLEQVKKVQEVFSKIQSALGNLQSAASTLSQVFTKEAENEATVETAKIEEQYASGLLSYEEYQKKKEAIDKEAAQKAYKAQMWAWSLEVLSATSGIASSLIQVLADKTLPTWAKIAMSATVGAAGAAQLASVIASKPTPPNFETGGIVGGNSYHGDKVRANVNSGEMILNARQQAQLWKTANEGHGAGGSGLSVQIKNYKGNDTRATPSLDGDKLTIVIDGTVNRSMSKGNYNKSLVAAQNGLDGTKYEN